MGSDKKCSNCGHFLEDAGDMKFRVEKYTGFGGLFVSGYDPTAGGQKFRLFRCPNCGKVDFYEPPE